MVSNIDGKTKSVKRILKTLSDEKWHKYGELLEKTKISSRTLTKHLDYLKECNLIKKEKREYPSAYYKAEPELVTWTEATFSIEEFSKQIEPLLLKTKNPFLVLDIINARCQGALKITIGKLMDEKNTPKHKLHFFLELFVWAPYRVFTWKLIETTKKHIDKIDSEQVIKYLKKKRL